MGTGLPTNSTGRWLTSSWCERAVSAVPSFTIMRARRTARRHAASTTGVEYLAMGNAARHLLESFEALSETDQREVLAQLFRRAAELPYAFPSDEELLQAADQIFQDLDRLEAKG